MTSPKASRAAAGAPGAWLVKQEPAAYSFSKLVADGKTTWDGVRNFQARNFLAAMHRRDSVLYYHSGDEKAVVGLARVSRAAFPDPSAKEGDWVAVEIEAVRPLGRPVPLATLKADPALSELLLVRQSRLSVMPVTDAQLARILELAATKR